MTNDFKSGYLVSMAINIDVSNWAIILIFILYILKDIGFFGYLFQKFLIKHEQDRDLTLESFRSNKANQNFIMSSAIESFYLRYNHIHEKRISAVEKIWCSMLQIRNSNTTVSAFYSLYTYRKDQNLYELIAKDSPLFKLLKELPYEKIKSVNSLRKENEVFRIFVGEEIWNLFSTYVNLYSVATLSLIEGTKDQEIKPLQDDKHLKSILERVLTKEETEQLYSYTTDFFKNIATLIEVKILTDIDKLISGNIVSENAVEQSYKLQKLLEDYGTEISY